MYMTPLKFSCIPNNAAKKSVSRWKYQIRRKYLSMKVSFQPSIEIWSAFLSVHASIAYMVLFVEETNPPEKRSDNLNLKNAVSFQRVWKLGSQVWHRL